jgi:hypothetical protein
LLELSSDRGLEASFKNETSLFLPSRSRIILDMLK